MNDTKVIITAASNIVSYLPIATAHRPTEIKHIGMNTMNRILPWFQVSHLASVKIKSSLPMCSLSLVSLKVANWSGISFLSFSYIHLFSWQWSSMSILAAHDVEDSSAMIFCKSSM